MDLRTKFDFWFDLKHIGGMAIILFAEVGLLVVC
jgi:hypothetical protein